MLWTHQKGSDHYPVLSNESCKQAVNKVEINVLNELKEPFIYSRYSSTRNPKQWLGKLCSTYKVILERVLWDRLGEC